MNPYSHIYLEIGDKLKQLREQKGLSQNSLAKMVGLTRTAIIHIEKGRQKAPLDKLYYIAESLETDIFDIIPPMRRPNAGHNRLISQLDIASRKRMEADELSQIFEAIEQRGGKINDTP